jgi:hypothetical protein
MNKNVIIIGALSLIGVGAFLYFKPKKTNQNIIPSSAGGLVPNSDNSVLPTPTSTSSVPPTQSNVTKEEVVLTPVDVVENALKISEAKNILGKILILRIKKNRYDNFNNIGTKRALNDFARESHNGIFQNNETMLKLVLKRDLEKINNQIKELDKNLGLLGYTEVNGSIQKI